MNRREILKSGAAGSLGLVAAAALLPDGAALSAQAQTAPAQNASSATPDEFRTEADSLGEVKVAADKLWGAQTQRSLEYFSIGSDLMPREMIASYATLKKAAANGVGARTFESLEPTHWMRSVRPGGQKRAWRS